MSAIRFGNHAEWYVSPDPVSVHDFEWQDMKAEDGMTASECCLYWGDLP